MEYYIEVKNVPSLLVLTHVNQCPASALEEMAYKLHHIAKASDKDSLFCISQTKSLKEEGEIKICCPIHSIDLEYDMKDFLIEVLPRTLVISTIHKGEYNDLKRVFEGMEEYIKKNKLVTGLPFRMIYHREKRDVDRSDFVTRPINEYVTEIQIPILDQ